jgi:hypothetical protein
LAIVALLIFIFSGTVLWIQAFTLVRQPLNYWGHESSPSMQLAILFQVILYHGPPTLTLLLLLRWKPYATFHSFLHSLPALIFFCFFFLRLSWNHNPPNLSISSG